MKKKQFIEWYKTIDNSVSKLTPKIKLSSDDSDYEKEIFKKSINQKEFNIKLRGVPQKVFFLDIYDGQITLVDTKVKEFVIDNKFFYGMGGYLFDNYLEVPDIKFKMGEKIQEIILN